MIFEHLPAYAKLLRHKSNRSNSSAFAVSAIVHLPGWFINMFARHRLTAAKTNNAAAAFFRLLPYLRGIVKIFS